MLFPLFSRRSRGRLGEEGARDRAAVEKRLRDLGLPFTAADEMLPAARWETLRYPLDTH
ncbi:MAG TPA: hypothetical protein VF173_11525 [Thermoanaerobaculia bacterium]|nr:hypothetical protein [Thermoanaerobaculia bacterium]